MQHSLITKLIIMLVVYLGLTYFGGEIGQIVLYPIRMLVTFLHELGHAVGALLTGGSVVSLEVRADGSGETWTRGGWRSIVLLGGYVGSAILGNVLFYIGAKAKPAIAEFTLYSLAGIMLLSSLFWFTSLFTTAMLLVFAAVLIFIARKTQQDPSVLMFLGLASILYIIQDFDVGPRSDLASYAEHFVILPASVWMYIWLAIVIAIFVYNCRLIFKQPYR